MPPLDALLASLQLHQWYPFAALLLTLAIQVVRGNETLRTYLWNWVPSGWRWVLPKLAGAVVGFTEAFASGQQLGAALLAAVGGALGIGLASMGWAAALKESPIPWDGGAGGDPRATSKLPPLDDSGPRSLNRMLMGVAIAMLGLVVLSSCSSSQLPDIKSPPSDPAARAEYFAEGVRSAVEAKEQAKREALSRESQLDALLRTGCSFFVTYRAFAPDLQALADVDAACAGYLSTPAPAKLEPAPEPAPAPTNPPAEPAGPAPADTPDASAPATT
jgi:hypothetical protein